MHPWQDYPMTSAHDEDTIAFYDREAADYAASMEDYRPAQLDDFIARVGAGAKVLELGCGAGRDAAAFIAAGVDVTPTDGSAKLAAIASERLGRPVRVMRFHELGETEVYDGVWASACLLHVPSEALADVLARVRRSLKAGGAFFASYKAGEGGDRDSLGRYYNFPSRAELEGFYESAGPWAEVAVETGTGGGYDGAALSRA